jgi:hypothetical protein
MARQENPILTRCSVTLTRVLMASLEEQARQRGVGVNQLITLKLQEAEPVKEETDFPNAAEYIRTGGTKCPFCGADGDQLDSGSFETDCNYSSREVTCDACDEEWTELYTMTGVTQDNGKDYSK